MKIFFKLLFVLVIFFSISAANAQVLQRLKNFLSGSTCETSSDCQQGYSCRSKSGGGTECKKTTDQAVQSKSAIEPVNALVNEKTSTGPTNDEKIIYFDYDSFKIKSEFQSTIEAHAQFLKTNNGAILSIEGHTDKRFPSLEYSLSIGQKRADAVRQSLTLLGVSASQIETVSFGREKPAVQGNNETAHAKNRRVELFYK